MPAKINLLNKKFGRLTVLSETGQRDSSGCVIWKCICICGKFVYVRGNSLRDNNTQSCGCLQLDAVNTHGMKNTTEYRSWNAILQRCNNPNSPNYIYYGGRGIKVCERWLKFENFVQDMGNKPTPKHSLDRIDSNKHYEPSNCKWSTSKEQGNNKRNNVHIDYKGEKLTQSEVSKRENVTNRTISNWLVKGLFKRWVNG